MSKAFSAENDMWIVKNHNPHIPVKVLTRQYNEFFGESRSTDTMKHHIQKLGLQQERRNWTEEQKEWLRQNAPLLSVAETCKQFNSKFGTNRSAQVLKVYCNRTLKVYHANCKYGVGCPVGTETMHGEYVWVKISKNTVHSKRGGFYQNWVPKHRYVWEQAYGKVPDGHTVIFLDSDKTNFALDNLYAVNGKVMREMSKKKWFFKNREMTLAAIKWCELHYAISEICKNDSSFEKEVTVE